MQEIKKIGIWALQSLHVNVIILFNFVILHHVSDVISNRSSNKTEEIKSSLNVNFSRVTFL